MRHFISGHLTFPEGFFESHYQPQIDKALYENAHFIIGDAPGIDTRAQQYLNGKTENVTIFHMFEKPRNNIGNWTTNGGYMTDNDRDAAMTANSDIDIAHSLRNKSGTHKNLLRRQCIKF